MSHTAINGNIFLFLEDQDRLCLGFSEDHKAELSKRHGSTDVMQYSVVMRGYPPVPAEITVDAPKPHALFREALNYAKTLTSKSKNKKS